MAVTLLTMCMGVKRTKIEGATEVELTVTEFSKLISLGILVTSHLQLESIKREALNTTI
jgi:hypothetical protein